MPPPFEVIEVAAAKLRRARLTPTPQTSAIERTSNGLVWPAFQAGSGVLGTNVGSIATNIGQIANIGHGPGARPSREEFRICSRSGGKF